jgi:hypothetical protein
LGDCDFCGTKNTSIYPARELPDFFRAILSLYELDTNSKRTLSMSIEEDFGIIKDSVTEPEKLLSSIFADELEEFSYLFNASVSLKNKDFINIETSDIHNIWNDFKKEIKFKNRYHIQNTINLDKLRVFFNHEGFYRIIKRGRIFYRSRLSDENGFSKDQMWNPPYDKATAGRANPKGISYLYLANDLDTALYETRAALFDYATIGEFKLKNDIKILNLRDPGDDPVFWSEIEEIEDFLIYIPFIKTLQKELSMPIRKKDKLLDYIPTQYISEYIKSLGFDGVEYESSINNNGYNLAIFNPEKFDCIATKVYEIDTIKISYNLVV